MNSIPLDKELILVDGLSTDRTRAIIKQYQLEFPGKIKLLDNPKRYVPFALNLAIKEATGKYIARIDAHTIYPSDYFEMCLEESARHNATNVGGYIESKGIGNMGKAIAYAMSCKFGVGDSDFRTVVKDGFVDTVPFGFWKKSAFKEFGLFDERLLRNQDDEYNSRIKSLGGSIYQSSKIRSEYYVRNSITKLFSQYFQYGLFKPLVLKKVKSGMRIRHLVPALFALYLLSLPISFLLPIYILPLVLYFLMDLYFSLNNNLTLTQKLYSLIAFPALHISYGTGFLFGIFKN